MPSTRKTGLQREKLVPRGLVLTRSHDRVGEQPGGPKTSEREHAGERRGGAQEPAARPARRARSAGEREERSPRAAPLPGGVSR